MNDYLLGRLLEAEEAYQENQYNHCILCGSNELYDYEKLCQDCIIKHPNYCILCGDDELEDYKKVCQECFKKYPTYIEDDEKEKNE